MTTKDSKESRRFLHKDLHEHVDCMMFNNRKIRDLDVFVIRNYYVPESKDSRKSG